MNNSLHMDAPEQEIPDNRVPLMREREAKLVRMIEALAALTLSREYSTLKDELFDGALESIDKRIRAEAEKAEVSTPELYRLQGEKVWARKYADLPKLTDTFRAELVNIRNNLKPL